MRHFNGSLLLSPSDLVAFVGCPHRTALDLGRLEGRIEEAPVAPDAATALVQTYGDLHELGYLGWLKARGIRVVEIDRNLDLDAQALATRQAMLAGSDVIYQATFLQPPFAGHADFLFRVEGPSDLGSFHYEVADTKLARSNRGKFLVQLCLYADFVAAAQGRLPEHVRVILGPAARRDADEAGQVNEVCLRTNDFRHHVHALEDRLLEFVREPRETRPVPVAACGQCGWRERCGRHWEETDHLSRVANIRSDQVVKLERAGVATMHELANLGQSIRGIGNQTLQRLKHQADLQSRPLDEGGRQRVEFRPLAADDADEPPRGFALLPEPDPGDLYFDMEGFPHEPGGLEYLFGVGHFEEGDRERWTFRAFWAHDHAEEKIAFEQFMDFVEQRLARFPGAHIYHYAAYEKSAIRRLSSLHDTRTTLRDRLLREGRLVDLYRVVNGALLLAVPSYSIKKVESYYRGAREGEVANAGESIVQYEAFRLATDEVERQRLLDDIERYNRDDVESTRQLHEWLEGLRPAGVLRFAPPPAEVQSPLNEREQEEAAARAGLEAWIGELPDEAKAWAQPVGELLGQLLGFYWRSALPGLWRKFDRMASEEHELLDDPDCLALLTFQHARKEARSVRYFYAVPPQDSKLYSGKAVVCLTDDRGVAKFEFDEDERIASFTRGNTLPAPPRTCTLVEAEGPSTMPKREAIFRFVRRLCHGREDVETVLGILRRDAPRLTGRATMSPVIPAATRPDADAVTAAVLAMDGTHLVIQGPPGTGKTTTAARVICELLRRGKRVGITANSHAALNHLLYAAWRRLGEGHPQHDCRAAITKVDPDQPTGVQAVRSEDIDSRQHRLAGGTAWLFCRPEQRAMWDYLFVDEASQVSLADVVAAGSCARNVVLLGDQMQLAQPTQGTHPGESGLSVLDYLMQEHATVPPHLGIFLGETYRMHPDVCRPISEGVYEDRLHSAPDCVLQRLVLSNDADPALRPTGVSYVPIPHEGNRYASDEEVRRVQQIYASLLRQSWVNAKGQESRLTPADVLVVTPFNAQAAALRRALVEGARVATVDKFQGQEGAVAILSMATSDAANVPRGKGFLFSRNRLNVAMSRARCLAIVVASPTLRTTECQAVDDMRLLNFYASITT
jgi:uncharacterized protein